MSAALPAGARCGRHPEDDATAICARCGDFVCAKCEVLVDGAMYCAKCLPFAGEAFPWERRKELGIARAALMTMRASILEPRSFARGFRDRSVLAALAYGGALSTFFAMCITSVELWPSDTLTMPVGPRPQPIIAFLSSDAGRILTTVATPVSFAVGAYIIAAGWWIGLKVVGAAGRPFGQIVRTVAYVRGSLAPFGLVALIPAPFGNLAAAVWLLVSFGLQAGALRVLMRTTSSRMLGAFFVASITWIISFSMAAAAAVVLFRLVP